MRDFARAGGDPGWSQPLGGQNVRIVEVDRSRGGGKRQLGESQRAPEVVNIEAVICPLPRNAASGSATAETASSAR